MKRMLQPHVWCIGPVLVAFFVAVGCVADELTSSNPKAFIVRVVDEQGRPVDGVEVGAGHCFGDMLLRDTGWIYEVGPVTSDANGVAHFAEDSEMPSSFSIYARHKGRQLVGVGNVDAGKQPETLTITMKRACHIRGSFVCPELETRGRKLTGTGVSIFLDGRYVIERWDKEPSFEFVLPAGEYQLKGNSLAGTYRIAQALTVPANETMLTLDPIRLPLTKLKLMELDNVAAPELTGIVAWKNSEPLRLADLRGKVVLLDFWGYWCLSCINKIPQLSKLHDQFHERGLVIIGIHVDVGDEIDTVAKLDEKLKTFRESKWNGRDIPFPVAMVPQNKISYGPNTTVSARSEVAANYGIQSYPTKVLIDQDGNVAGRFNFNKASDVKRLENMLGTRSTTNSE